MRIDYILKAAAKRMQSVTVDCDSAYSTVCISTKGEGDIFMQGEDAETFMAECEAMSARCKALSIDVIERALAEPYAENLWN